MCFLPKNNVSGFKAARYCSFNRTSYRKEYLAKKRIRLAEEEARKAAQMAALAKAQEAIKQRNERAARRRC